MELKGRVLTGMPRSIILVESTLVEWDHAWKKSYPFNRRPYCPPQPLSIKCSSTILLYSTRQVFTMCSECSEMHFANEFGWCKVINALIVVQILW